VCVCVYVCVCARLCVCACACVPFLRIKFEVPGLIEVANPAHSSPSQQFMTLPRLVRPHNDPQRPYLRQSTTCSHRQFTTVLEDCFARRCQTLYMHTTMRRIRKAVTKNDKYGQATGNTTSKVLALKHWQEEHSPVAASEIATFASTSEREQACRVRRKRSIDCFDLRVEAKRSQVQ